MGGKTKRRRFLTGALFNHPAPALLEEVVRSLPKLQRSEPTNISEELAAIRRQLAHQASEIAALKEINKTSACCG